MDDNAIIRTRELSIKFGSHTAVNCVSLDIPRNSFCSIIGPNGAGKTTFFNLISGQLMPSSGVIELRGKDITHLPAYQRVRAGIGRTFQITNVFPNLTVLENVRLAVQSKAKIHFNIFRHYRSFKHFIAKAEELLRSVNLEEKAGKLAFSLSHGDKRKLELALILALEPEVLLLDEPTAGMAIEEVPSILELLGKLKAKGNHTFLLVEHKIDMVMSLSDRIIVLANGQLLAQGNPQEIMSNEVVQASYLGGMSG